MFRQSLDRNRFKLSGHLHLNRPFGQLSARTPCVILSGTREAMRNMEASGYQFSSPKSGVAAPTHSIRLAILRREAFRKAKSNANYRKSNRLISPFRINTCKSVSKQRTLSTFRMNTCEKPGGRGDPCPCSAVPKRKNSASIFLAIASLHIDPQLASLVPWPRTNLE
jgi:hypothetical protein